MKKLISLLLALVMILGLTACGTTATPTDPATEPANDVTEEVTRLKSHFAQFDRFLTDAPESAGRSMDFLLQEMFREITTLGNKAGSSGVSPHVVAFKTELEKLREQVQNVE